MLNNPELHARLTLAIYRAHKVAALKAGGPNLAVSDGDKAHRLALDVVRPSVQLAASSGPLKAVASERGRS